VAGGSKNKSFTIAYYFYAPQAFSLPELLMFPNHFNLSYYKIRFQCLQDIFLIHPEFRNNWIKAAKNSFIKFRIAGTLSL